MKKWMNSRAKLGVVFFAATAVASCGAGAEAASGGFFTEVPAGDWSYEAVNELISAGAVPEYEVQIPAGRVIYDLWATYRREPGLTMPTVTDWWEPNKEGYRIGFDYVLDKNLTFTTWMNWFKDIDTSERTRRFRFQVDAFF